MQQQVALGDFMSMFRRLPPAGSPVGISDIARALAMRIGLGGGGDNLTDLVRSTTGARHCFLLDSGRTALMIGLKAMKALVPPHRDEVIIPAYTCFTVAAAVVRAGLKIRPVDIDPDTMDFNYDRLQSAGLGNVLAVVGDNLFGIPGDWRKLRCLTRQNGIYLIDDAAQSMGTRIEGRASGAQGHLGFYSLGRGKNLTAYSGGILVTDDDRLAGAVAAGISAMSQVGVASEMVTVLKILLMSQFVKPRLFWLPASLPFLKLGETVFDANFAVGRLARFQKHLTESVYPHLDDYNDARRRNAMSLARAIDDLPRYSVAGYNGNECPAYLRLPVLAENRFMRDRILAALNAAGVTASIMYPSTIGGIPGIEPHLASPPDSYPGAQQVVDRLFTLPTHPYVTSRDVERMTTILREEHA